MREGFPGLADGRKEEEEEGVQARNFQGKYLGVREMVLVWGI